MKLNGNNSRINSEYSHTTRPWGGFDQFALNTPCTPKILQVLPGESLSLQFHEQRDQHYVFIDDDFKVVYSDIAVPHTICLNGAILDWFNSGHKIVNYPSAGDQYYFRRRVIHRAEYTGTKPLGLIFEVAYGHNDEEDIVRLSDKYGRSQAEELKRERNHAC